MIEIRDLHKSFSGKPVIGGLSFYFDDGVFYLISGPSGCGKSTLLRIIAGLDRKYSGLVRAPLKASMSFQDIRLFPWLNVVQNASVGLWSDNADGGDVLAKAGELLTELGIAEEYFKASPGELSGGMQARVGLARALLRDAGVYLFDEPFANLDKDTAALCGDVIRKRVCVPGKHCLIVSHNTDTFPDARLLECRGTPVNTLATI